MERAEKVSLTTHLSSAQVFAIAVWARGLGFARNGHLKEAREQPRRCGQIEGDFAHLERLLGNPGQYHDPRSASLVGQRGPTDEATAVMRSAADDETESRNSCHSRTIPAANARRAILEQGNFASASKAFETALVNAPGRRGALQGAARAAHPSAQK